MPSLIPTIGAPKLGRVRLAGSVSATIALLMLLTVESDATAQPSSQSPSSDSPQRYGPPWVDGGDNLPPWAKSVRITRADEPLKRAPDESAERRGSGQLNTRLPIFGMRAGPGCAEPFFHVGPGAWVCGDHVELSGNPAVPAGDKSWKPSLSGLPFRYFFVGSDGAFGYKQLLAVDVGQPDFQLDPGFAVAIVEERMLDGYPYGLTNNELWVPMRDLTPVRASAFQGAELPKDVGETIPVAWVHNQRARVFRTASTAQPTGRTLERLDTVAWLEKKGQFQTFVRIGKDEWVATSDVRHPTRQPPPAEVDLASRERWIDVDLETQTLIAYEGDRPVFATMVSTGKGRQGTANQTPKGVHRVWVKLLSSDMDNLEDEYANRYWRMEDVPYVQYFSKGVGLHGAFWHRSFGRGRSHGCVNLAPLDAERLFWWTGPALPSGWTAILPTDREKGALIRVR